LRKPQLRRRQKKMKFINTQLRIEHLPSQCGVEKGRANNRVLELNVEVSYRNIKEVINDASNRQS
jgi:hypothetical protein